MLISLTKRERLHVQEVFKRLAREAGSQSKLAKSLNLTKSAISHLTSGNFLPSARVCVTIESKYGIKKEDLRPDIFMIN